MNAQTAASALRVPAVLSPACALIDRLKTGPRLGVVIALLLIPGLIALWSYDSSLRSQIAFSEAERQGTEVLVPALLATADAAHVERSGPVDLAGLESAVADHPELDLTEEMEAVRVAAGDTSTPQARVGLVTSLATLTAEVANQSNLILDPDLDSFYIVEALVIELPEAFVDLAKLGAPVPDGADPTAERAVQIGVLEGILQGLGKAVETSIESSDRDIAEPLQGLAAASSTAEGLVAAADLSGRPADVEPAVTAFEEGVEPAADTLVTLLTERISGLEQQRMTTLVIAWVGFILALYLSVGLVWRTRQDVAALVTAVQAMSDGDLEEKPVPHGKDEFGEIGHALGRTREALVESNSELQRREQEREAQSRVAFRKQREAEAQVRRRAQEVIDETSTAVSSELSEVVEQVTAMRSAADAIDTHVAEADRVTSTVVDQARDTDEVVETLGESLRRVGGMAKLIAGVADQSKLLALNATIEAARAGEAGKGFGVVAGEVKELATATASSTDQISSTVSDLERDTEAVSTAISRMSEGIRGVDQAAGSLREVAERQRSVVEALDRVVSTTMTRIRDMSELNEQLERRRHERVSVTHSAALNVGGDNIEVQLMDMSEGGLRMRAPKKAAIDVGAQVLIDLELNGVVFSAPGTVMGCDEVQGGLSVGVRFNDLAFKAQQTLRDYVTGILSEQMSDGSRPPA